MNRYKEIHITPHTKEWHDFRMNGYGASEISGVLAAYDDNLANDTYNDPMRTHHHKIGEPVTTFTGNRQSEAGVVMETIIIDLFRHFDIERDDSEHMYKNKNGRFGKPIKYNRVIRRTVYVVNKKYPWLFASPDGVMYEGNGTIKVNVNLPRIAIECKNTTSMTANKYANRVSPAFICQVMQVLLLTGWKKAYIAIHIDGNDLVVFPVEPNKEFFQWIIESSQESWLKVEKARAIKKEFRIEKYFGLDMDFINPNHHEPVAMLQKLEPEFNGTDVQHAFITEHIKPTSEYSERTIRPEEEGLIMQYLSLKGQGDKLKHETNKIQDKLIISLGGYHKAVDENNEKLWFSYKPDINGNKSFTVSAKLKNKILDI